MKKVILVVYDILAMIGASVIALFLRFEGRYEANPRQYLDKINQYIFIVIGISIVIFYIMRLYGSLWSYAGTTELVNILVASILSAGVQMAVYVLVDVRMPRSYYVFYGAGLFVFVIISRYSYRVIRTMIKRQRSNKSCTNVLVVGAGGAGNMLVREIDRKSVV